MRIAYLGAAPSTSAGVGYAATVILEALVLQGLEIDVYTTAEPTSARHTAGLRFLHESSGTIAGSWLARLPFVRSVVGQVGRAAGHARLVKTLAKEHARKRYDVIYQFSQPEILTLRRNQERLPPIVLHPEVHAAGELRWHRREDALARQCESRVRTVGVRVVLAIRARAQRRDLRRVDAVVAPSAMFADELFRDYGIARTRMHVVPNPVDLVRFHPPAERVESREIVFVSRLAVRKGVELITDLSHRLDDLAGQIKVMVIGEGSQWSDYTCLLSSLNERVATYVGYEDPDELAMRLQSAAMLVQPSHYEPFALSVAEALACGTPVVVSDAVGAGEWLDHTCSEVFAHGDVVAFEVAVRRMLSRLETDEVAIRRAARSAAERNFAPGRVAISLCDVFRGVA